MTEEKARRVKKAVIVGAVLLLAILLTILIYQLIDIGVKRRYINELETKITYYLDLKASGEEELDVLATKEWIIRRAKELGYVFPDDVRYEDFV